MYEANNEKTIGNDIEILIETDNDMFFAYARLKSSKHKIYIQRYSRLIKELCAYLEPKKHMLSGGFYVGVLP